MGISFIESTVTEITKDADGLLDASTELQTFMSRLRGVFRGVKFEDAEQQGMGVLPRRAVPDGLYWVW